MNGGDLVLTLQVPYTGGQTIPAETCFQSTPIRRMQVVISSLATTSLPFHQPITLSSAVVIDDLNFPAPKRAVAGHELEYRRHVFAPAAAVSGLCRRARGPMHFPAART